MNLRSLTNRKRRLDYAGLESRRLLASVTLTNGELQIVGADSDDLVTIDVDNEQATIKIGGEPSENKRFDRDQIDSIWFWGGNGNDQLKISGVLQDDSWRHLTQVEYYGGSGDDVFEFRVSGVSTADVLAVGGEGDDTLRAVTITHTDVTNPVRFVGGAGDDLILGGEADDTLLGGAGNDTIIGNGGNDQINGGAGWDSLIGGLGNDMLLGGWGNDHINGGWGDDILFGGQGHDTLAGSDGIDMIYSGVGDDSSFGGKGDDVINSGDGDDRSFGGQGNDRLVGGAGNDLLHGFTGDDVLMGQAGRDRLFGYQGNNLLLGGFGDDVLHGGTGFDRVFGEAGNDWLGDSLEDITDFVFEQDRRNVALTDFIGLTESAAVELAESMDRENRVYWRDGENAYCLGAADFIARRLEFSIEDGIVIAVRTDTMNWAGRFLNRNDRPDICQVV